jgi:hypothetical protein
MPAAIDPALIAIPDGFLLAYMRDFWEDIEIIYFSKSGKITRREQIQVSKNLPKISQPDNTHFLNGFFPYSVSLGYDPKKKVYLLVARDFRYPGSLVFFGSTGGKWIRMWKDTLKLLYRIRSMGDVTIMCSDSSSPYNCTLAFTTDLSWPGVWLGGTREESRIWLLKFGINSGNPPTLNFNFEEIETRYHFYWGVIISTPAVVLDNENQLVRMLLQPYKRYDGRCSDIIGWDPWPCPDVVSHIHPYLPPFRWGYQPWSIHSRYNGNIIYGKNRYWFVTVRGMDNNKSIPFLE